MRGLCLRGWRDRPTRGWRGEGCLSSHTMVDGYRNRRRKRSRGAAQLWGNVAAQMPLHHPVVPIASSCIGECVRAPGAYEVTETETRAGRQNVLTAYVGVYTPYPRAPAAAGGGWGAEVSAVGRHHAAVLGGPRPSADGPCPPCVHRHIGGVPGDRPGYRGGHPDVGTTPAASPVEPRPSPLSSCPLADGFPPSALP